MTELAEHVDLDPTTLAEMMRSLSEEGRPVLLDFDHTLFASNSTELFLASARPAFLVSLLLGFARGAFPWHLYSARYRRLRDSLIVATVIVLMPWTLFAWRRNGPALFRRYTAHSLATALAHTPSRQVTIISYGFEPIIRPLLNGSSWEACRLICVGVPHSPRQIMREKTAVIRSTSPQINVRDAVFITDSDEDRDLLDAAAIPYLIPRQGPEVLADTRLYLPWRYTSLGKYNRPWVIDQALRVDLVLAFLATQSLWIGSTWGVVAVVLFYISLHCIYEIGYFENDFEAATHEVSPTLTDRVEMFRGLPLERHAWIWGAFLGVLGCYAAARPYALVLDRFIRLLVVWGLVLATTRVVFHIYNRQPEERRLLLYPILQQLKYFGLLTVLPSYKLGAALLWAQVAMMWMNYVLYRLGGRKADFPREEVRLAAFVTFGLSLIMIDPSTLSETTPLALICLITWPIWRVARQFLQRRRRLRR